LPRADNRMTAAKARVFRRCVRCVAVRNLQKVAHGGTATTARNQTAAESHILTYFCETIAGEQVAAHGQQDGSGESKFLQALCSLCRCEKFSESGSRRHSVHSAEANGGGRVREMARVKVCRRCVRCVAVRNFQKVAHGGTATTAQNQTAAGGRKQKPPNAVFVVSL